MPVPLFLSRVHFPIRALGPGRRAGVWFQGCSIRCAGCISADTWGFGRGETTVDAVVETLMPWLNEADGVTVSGGEPFDQPNALIALLREIRARFDHDMLVYTGYALEAVEPVLLAAEGLIDALITDPYDAAALQTLPLRGSDNQRLHLLTNLAQSRFRDYEAGAVPNESKLDVMFDDGGTIWFAGVPKRGDFSRLQRTLQARGHLVATSEDRHRRRGEEQ